MVENAGRFQAILRMRPVSNVRSMECPSMKSTSIGAWRERTRIGMGLSIIAAGAGLQLLQWLHL
jgi:hypothetical protein